MLITTMSATFKILPVSDTLKVIQHLPVKIPVISVGSGRGQLEGLIKLLNQERLLVCVDSPNWRASDVGVIQAPIHPTPPDIGSLDALLADIPDISTKGEDFCLMLKMPKTVGIEDLQAIVKLKPTYVFIIYEMTGNAGGSLFLHHWINAKVEDRQLLEFACWIGDLEFSDIEQHRIYHEALRLPKYETIASISRTVDNGLNFARQYCAMLIKKKTN